MGFQDDYGGFELFESEYAHRNVQLINKQI